jgi:LCP family protein required for cell wall assembly
MAMTQNQKFTLGVLSILACGLLAMVLITGMQTYQTWSRQPLALTLDFPVAITVANEIPTYLGVSQPTVTLAFTPPIATETQASTFLACDDLPSMTILLIGTDARSSEYRTGRADVIRAVRVDYREQRVTTLEFPRDLWVKVPGIERNLKTDHQKLNTAYTYGNPEGGPALLAQTLDLNFGLKAEHYIVINMNVFVEVVDALGGLEVMIPAGGIDGRTSSDRSARLVFPEGVQVLSGEQALTLARIRNISVFQRAEHQNLVACALQKKIKRPEVILKLPALINTFINNIRTDLTPVQISQLACLGTQMPRENIVFVHFPLKLFKSAETFDPVLKQDVFVWDVDFVTLRGYVAEYQEGSWPMFSEAGTAVEGATSCE